MLRSDLPMKIISFRRPPTRSRDARTRAIAHKHQSRHWESRNGKHEQIMRAQTETSSSFNIESNVPAMDVTPLPTDDE